MFPMVIMVLLGIIQYGYHFWAMSQGSAVAREVARLAIVNTEWSCGEAWGVKQAALPAVGSAVPTVVRSFPGGGGASSSGVVQEGTRIRVTVSFDSFYLGLFPLPNQGRIVETANARVEYAPSLMTGGDKPQACPEEYRAH